MIAALYVLKDGPYIGLPDVAPWPESRDARTYPGPWPVVAHPPCARWGFFWWGGPTAKVRREMGDDGGCFAAAIAAVRKWGGVLEHPANSRAWVAFGLPRPPRGGGWIRALAGGWCTHVEQGQYGHEARKATWLYAVNTERPALKWGPGPEPTSWCSNLDLRNPRRPTRTGVVQLMSKRQCALTPIPFRDLLLFLARSVPQESSPWPPSVPFA